MALIEKTIIDRIEILENNTIQVREATIITKDDHELTRTYHRYVLAPDQDISDQNDKIKVIANAIWTDEVIAAYKEKIAENFKDLT